ncbi:MAG TPA: phosphoenolpyruvate--protein phosphotransferase [Burkholderiaceae bacterium]|nr:phosphoenolpyruvate--protein phosphotransferase [Burkholderiaceae bacterium]
MTLALHGTGVSRGVAIGRAWCIEAAFDDVEHRTLAEAERDDEIQRYQRALDDVREEFAQVRRHIPDDAPPELPALLQVHEMILADPALVAQPMQLVRTRGMNAEWALAETAGMLVEQFDAMDDPYLRERKQDLMQVVARVRKALAGRSALRRIVHATPDEARILVAPDLAPADMLHFRHEGVDAPHAFRIAAFCTEFGGRTSHTAILARSMNVPAVVGTHGAMQRIEDDDIIVIDGDAGVVLVDPDEATLAFYRAKLDAQATERSTLNALTVRRAVTLDGRVISLNANIELPEDAYAAMDANADGIGLFRSEFLFMNRNELPSEDEQFEAYRTALVAMEGRPVTIRTLDIGADKTLQHDEAARPASDNPALGLRAIRYSLAEPAMFGAQLRALLRASAYGRLRILVPMLSCAAEIDAVLAHIAQAKNELIDRRQAFAPKVPVGGMVEVPAAALAIRAFTSRLDFLSIGTNDLIQYTLAIDRADSRVADLYDPLHPAVLQLISQTIHSGASAGLDVALCGEMAGDIELTDLLVGLGLTQFSMHPAQLPYIKRAVLDVHYGRAKLLADQALAQADARDIRRLLALVNATLKDDERRINEA